MSTNLKTNTTDNNKPVHNSSFNGGGRGKCFQLTQINSEFDANTVQMTKAQVVEQVAIMTQWLAE